MDFAARSSMVPRFRLEVRQLSLSTVSLSTLSSGSDWMKLEPREGKTVEEKQTP